MPTWIFVLAGLIVIVALIIKSLIKDIKSGKGTCSCGCANCHGQCCKKTDEHSA
ncbi:MAG: FeoB-associated Cys-rich membrane protein [Firmicutes bacterium]|nr:FeoB-associated Cys-rich membrane protein [Bacillota bacterium]